MKNILILGASGILGSELVNYLKNENLTLAGRSYQTGEHHVFLDLTDLNSIRTALTLLMNQKWDVIFINSGGIVSSKILPFEIENNFMLNAVGPYFLLKGICQKQANVKVIITSSISILRASIKKNKGKWLYRNSKLFELMLMECLKRELPQIKMIYAHPGITPSPISYHLHGKVIGYWLKQFASRPKDAVRPILMAYEDSVAHEEQGWYVPGGFFHLRGKPKWQNKEFHFPWIEFQNKIKQIERMYEDEFKNYGL